MSEGKILKSLTPGEREMELINTYSRRALAPEEVYCFSLVLCDNELDRDFEQFATDQLEAIAALFVGKTGIFDHDPSAKNQCARIFRCAVSTDPTIKTTLGEDYSCVVAEAYIPKTEGNLELIEQIDSGIKKEVSLSCAVRQKLCSICGYELDSCECVHKKGQIYGDSLCYGVLSGIYDAYEWSFVAVPAQRGAGVIKSKNKEGEILDSVYKRLQGAGEVTLTHNDKAELVSYIERLKSLSRDGEEYRRSLIDELVRLNVLSKSSLPPKVLRSVSERMTISELKAFSAAYKQPPQPQLSSSSTTEGSRGCDEYSI